VLVLLTAAIVIVAATIPLARHLWSSPANAPHHVPHRSGEEEINSVSADRFSTRWGGWTEDMEREEAQ